MNIIFCIALFAQTAIVPKPIPVPEPPVIPQFRPASIRTSETPVDVKCTTRIVAENGLYRKLENEIVLTNPNSRVFEGEFEFPVPEGATVCGYSLEVNGNMVPGVVVGKDEARIAFENEKRKGVDPGIVEHVKGNVWRTRVYPLLPNKPRRLTVTCIQPEAKPVSGVVVERFEGEVFVGQALADVAIPLGKADRVRAFKKGRIFWDASFSRNGKVQADRTMLELLPEDGDWELIVFRNVVETPMKFAKRTELLKFVDALVYDGGTEVPEYGRDDLAFSDEIVESRPRRIEIRKLKEGEKAPSEPVESSLLATAWAANRVEDLEGDAGNHKKEFLDLGRKYGIAGKGTSLMVLESLDQYVKYNVEPPKCMTFHDEWVRICGAKDSAINLEREKTEHRSQLLQYWQERVTWWNDPIPKKPTPKSGLFDGVRAAAGNFAETSVRSVQRTGRSGARMGARMANVAAADMDEEVAVPAAAAPAERLVERKAESAAVEPNRASSPQATIKIAAWNPDMPYLKAIDKAQDKYGEYLRQRDAFGSSPAFFLDVSGWFFKNADGMLARRIISNLVEFKVDDVGLWRTMGWRLREAGAYPEAIKVFRMVLKLRPEEAQSKRDLALVLAESGKRDFARDADVAASELEEAMRLFHDTAFIPTARRSGRRGNDMQASVIALEELNGLIAWCAAQKWANAPKPPALDEAFRRDLPVKLRIVLSWDTDETDIDLHVLEPEGEEAFYGHRRTSHGGFVSQDVTTGYGPEEYLRKDTTKGVYRILSNYYASHRQQLTGAAVISATVYTDWATEREKMQIISFRLDKPKDKHPIGEVKMD